MQLAGKKEYGWDPKTVSFLFLFDKGTNFELEHRNVPAAFLKPGEQITHIQNIYHFTGREKHLDKLTRFLLKVPIKEINNAFRTNID